MAACGILMSLWGLCKLVYSSTAVTSLSSRKGGPGHTLDDLLKIKQLKHTYNTLALFPCLFSNGPTNLRETVNKGRWRGKQPLSAHSLRDKEEITQLM